MTVHIGETLKNRYKIVESLGRGGMADVYKVWDEERSTYLALKLLRDDLAQDPVFMRRFRREAHNLAQLQHPNIVRFYGLEEDDLKAFILMEYIEGPTLREEIRRSDSGGMSQERIQSVMKDVCSALHYAHAKGLVHCDIKSGNILIDAYGKAYLTDFGIARGMDMATSTMVGIGTPAYMAPELIKGQDPTPQTDIYALGIVLYEMLTGGERPFTGERAEITGTTADKVRWEHLKMNPAPISQFNPNVDTAFQGIVNCCLQKEPKNRFKSVIEIRDALNFPEGIIQSSDAIVEKQNIEFIQVHEKSKSAEESENAYCRVDAPLVNEFSEKKEEEEVQAERISQPAKQEEETPRKQTTTWGIVVAVIVVGMIIGLLMVKKTNKKNQSLITPTNQITESLLETKVLNEKIIHQFTYNFSDEIISKENVESIRELFQLGNGALTTFELSTDGNTLYFGTSSGLGYFNVDSNLFNDYWLMNERVLDIFNYQDHDYAITFDSSGADIEIWDIKEKEKIDFINVGISYLYDAVVSNNGEYLLFENNNEVYLWNLNTKTLLNRIKKDGWPRFFTFSPDGKYYAVSYSNGVIDIWDMRNSILIESIKSNIFLEDEPDDLMEVIFLPDSKYIAASTWNGDIAIWNLDTEIPVRTYKNAKGWLSHFLISPDKKYIYTGSPVGGEMNVIDINEDFNLYSIKIADELINDFFFIDSEHIVFNTINGEIQIKGIRNGIDLTSFDYTVEGQSAFSISPLNNRLALSSNDSILFWDPREPNEILKIETPTYVNSIEYSNYGDILAVGGSSEDNWNIVYLYNVDDLHLLNTFYGSYSQMSNSLSFSTSGNLLAVGVFDGRVEIWNLDTGEEVGDFGCGNLYIYGDIAFSPTSDIVAAGSRGCIEGYDSSDGIINLYDIDTQSKRTFHVHNNWVRFLLFNSDGSRLISGSWDDTVKISDVNTGTVLEDIYIGENMNSLSMTSDDELIVFSTDDEVIFWDVESNSKIKSIYTRGLRIEELEFSPSGNLLFGRTADGIVLVWGIPL